MKNVILGIIGIFITLYTLLIGLNILTIQSHKNQLEKNVSRIVKNVLEGEYQKGEKEAVQQMLLEEISASISSNGTVTVEIQEIDLQKGILSLKVTDQIRTLTGASRQLVIEKTAIMEQTMTSFPKCSVTFMVEGEVYKEYQVEKGHRCPEPKPPVSNQKFLGWKEYGTDLMIMPGQLDEIQENRVYVAVFQ